jgi:hypothetical protein
MNEEREDEVRIKIMQIINAVEPLSISEKQIAETLDMKLVPPVGKGEFDDAINWLCAFKHFIRTVPDRVNEHRIRWAQTNAGHDWLISINPQTF